MRSICTKKHFLEAQRENYSFWGQRIKINFGVTKEKTDSLLWERKDKSPTQRKERKKKREIIRKE